MKRVAFKANPARMGYRELFRVAGSPGTGLLICAFKLFRLLGPDSGGFGFRETAHQVRPPPATASTTRPPRTSRREMRRPGLDG